MKIVGFLFYFSVLSFAGFAQSSVLWEIKGNDLTQSSYLLGTLKFTGEKEFFIPKQVSSKMSECKVFAIEDPIDHHAQHELNKALHFPKGQSLSTQLSSDEYKKVQLFFEKEFGINKSSFESKYSIIKPLALSILMTRLSLGEKAKFCDIELLLAAKKKKLTTYSLESVEREAQAINAYPMYNQIKALLHSIDNFETQKAEFRKMIEQYPQESLEEIFQFTLHPVENNPIFVEEFYYKRNVEWLPKIEKMIKENRSFITVGVSHLEGEKGLLKLLTDKGYILSPIPVTK
ncbi:MAG: TraB/GumN family protein [Cyclobacteriaceae bacterium]|nr:TraB/GumN family protein [Cyclobacteriaceae bacterium]